MNATIRNALRTIFGGCILLLAACSGTTTIKSDLVLQPASRARIELHQQTQAIELLNDSDANVRVTVLGKKDRVVSNLLLGGHDQARLDLMPARALQFDNHSDEQAVIRWVMRNDDRIEYTLAVNPTIP